MENIINFHESTSRSVSLQNQIPPIEWAEFSTPQGFKYYYNRIKNFSTWFPPQAMILPLPDQNPVDLLAAWKENYVAEIKKKLLKTAKTDRPIKMSDVTGSDWQIIKTSQGRIYYYSTSENKSTWDRPQELESLFQDQFNSALSLINEDQQETPIEGTEMGEDDVSWMLEQVQQENDSADSDNDGISLEQENVPDIDETINQSPAQISEEQKKSSFLEMLLEKPINPFGSWENEIASLADDPRYIAIESPQDKKLLFNQACKQLIAQRKQKTTNMPPSSNSKLTLFEKLVYEFNTDPPMSWNEFYKKYRKDARFLSVPTLPQRKSLYSKFLEDYKKKQKEIQETIKSDFFKMLSEYKELSSTSKLSDFSVKLKYDIRFIAAGSDENKSRLFNEYLEQHCDAKSRSKPSSKTPDYSKKSDHRHTNRKNSDSPKSPRTRSRSVSRSKPDHYRSRHPRSSRRDSRRSRSRSRSLSRSRSNSYSRSPDSRNKHYRSKHSHRDSDEYESSRRSYKSSDRRSRDLDSRKSSRRSYYSRSRSRSRSRSPLRSNRSHDKFGNERKNQTANSKEQQALNKLYRQRQKETYKAKSEVERARFEVLRKNSRLTVQNILVDVVLFRELSIDAIFELLKKDRRLPPQVFCGKNENYINIDEFILDENEIIQLITQHKESLLEKRNLRFTRWLEKNFRVDYEDSLYIDKYINSISINSSWSDILRIFINEPETLKNIIGKNIPPSTFSSYIQLSENSASFKGDVDTDADSETSDDQVAIEINSLLRRFFSNWKKGKLDKLKANLTEAIYTNGFIEFLLRKTVVDYQRNTSSAEDKSMRVNALSEGSSTALDKEENIFEKVPEAVISQVFQVLEDDARYKTLEFLKGEREEIVNETVLSFMKKMKTRDLAFDVIKTRSLDK
ncbi:hypothetical protein BB560_005408 [Smittium megazygosporum]|uniref:WW domain-containing protein n=1 Tax=Smittium megazygosporum TaxID=133381 RepID=A0A2T9Z639_9FUNG|nr:hypothetical protein BB560_005408 [Smittium megazygosporum]